MNYTISKFLAAYKAATTSVEKQTESSHFYKEMEQFDYSYGHIFLKKGREILCLLHDSDEKNLYIDLTSCNRFGEYEDIDTVILLWEKQDQKRTMRTLITNFLKNYKEAQGPIERNLRAFTFEMEAMEKFGFAVMAISFVDHRHVMMLSNDDMDYHYFVDFDSGHFGKYESLNEALNNWNVRDKFPIGNSVYVLMDDMGTLSDGEVVAYEDDFFLIQDPFGNEFSAVEADLSPYPGLFTEESPKPLSPGDKVSFIPEEGKLFSATYWGETETTFILAKYQAKDCYPKKGAKIERWPDNTQNE